VKLFRIFLKGAGAAGVALALLAPSPLFACATCFGKSDAPMAQGMNSGIFTLMGVIVTVLATILAFFIYIIRRETAALKELPPQPQPQPEV
jgi:heme/copper-type cytochrome/quinol oxidase subunit 2